MGSLGQGVACMAAWQFCAEWRPLTSSTMLFEGVVAQAVVERVLVVGCASQRSTCCASLLG